MNFQQLKIIKEAARCEFNLTDVANALFTSQSGVSRHIRDLEDELGVEIFIRRGKRLLGMTEPGKALLTIAERILDEAGKVRRLADVFTNESSGVLTIATTHTQARYSLPKVIKAFRVLYPNVRLELNQGSPQEIVSMLTTGEADVGIASEQMVNNPALATFPWFSWHHALLVPKGHELEQKQPVSLAALARFPLITYRQGITGRSKVDRAFQAASLQADIVLSAQDSDVVKTYVELGLGVGILADQACQLDEHALLTRLDARHLFESNTVWLGLKRGQLQRNFVWQFLELCNANLSLEEIKRQALSLDEEEPAIDFQI
ncbi:HTH-type transcriptional regulator Cbl [Erwinia tasmaniensis]|uniref:Transcriptional regulator cys regulon n=1 Tax=Erwinia tasmaniensis (strain DSM 17950 / CFBP 7177 / CIP 109463 / NCPPB 4357 / Et1/99) TaxID=465817 RepID=B2VFI9_ERWT9|nr:HTH-type transcriptional regulator Cbl [Erwinia tasmaniensis]CAO96428.1 Transcriptional regulator cys regulon [Erwinia tasmaniensis Et1/99]